MVELALINTLSNWAKERSAAVKPKTISFESNRAVTMVAGDDETDGGKLFQLTRNSFRNTS
jgi:hypothetical protein